MKDARRIGRMLVVVVMMAVAAVPLNCAKQKESAPKAAAAKKAPVKEAPAKDTSVKALDAVLRIGGPAPAIELEDEKGSPINLKKFKGKNLVISFWDTPCKFCLTQAQIIEKEIDRGNLDVELLMISPGDTADKRKESIKVLRDAKLKAKAAFDTKMKTIASYQVSGIPYLALIDDKGRLQAAGSFLVTEKMASMDFIGMMKSVASGKNIPKCELASAETPEKYKKMIGKQAPDFKAKDLGGNDESPAFYKGFSRLLLVFWSPGCPHCRAELPRLEVFKREIAKKRGVYILGVTELPDSKDDLNKEKMNLDNAMLLTKNLGVTFPSVVDKGQKIMESYNVEGFPTMFLIGKDGKFEEVFSGEMLFTVEGLDCVLDRLDSRSGKGR